MATSATEKELHDAAEAVQETLRCSCFDEAVECSLAALRRLVPCEFAALTQLNPASALVVTDTDPGGAAVPSFESTREFIFGHPLAAAVAVPKPPAALRISDVLADAEWREHPVRHHMVEMTGESPGRLLERQAGSGMFDGQVITAAAVNRLGSDFSDRDVEVLKVLAPGLVAARRLWEQVAAWQAVAAAAADGAEWEVRDPTGRIVAALPPASGGQRSAGKQAVLAARFTLVRRPTLTHGMSSREIEVMRLAAAGLTADAMGRRLQLSTRTVHKHLEHAYRKLGVSDRVSAVRAAARAGLLDDLLPVQPAAPAPDE